MSSPTIILNQSGQPLRLGELDGIGDILDADVIAAHAGETGVRLWLTKADAWRIRCHGDDRCEEGKTYEFVNYQTIVDTEDEVDWLMEWGRRIYEEPCVFRDDMPAPLPCLACQARGKLWSCACLPMYQAHMRLDHAG